MTRLEQWIATAGFLYWTMQQVIITPIAGLAVGRTNWMCQQPAVPQTLAISSPLLHDFIGTDSCSWPVHNKNASCASDSFYRNISHWPSQSTEWMQPGSQARLAMQMEFFQQLQWVPMDHQNNAADPKLEPPTPTDLFCRVVPATDLFCGVVPGDFPVQQYVHNFTAATDQGQQICRFFTMMQCSVLSDHRAFTAWETNRRWSEHHFPVLLSPAIQSAQCSDIYTDLFCGVVPDMRFYSCFGQLFAIAGNTDNTIQAHTADDVLVSIKDTVLAMLDTWNLLPGPHRIPWSKMHSFFLQQAEQWTLLTDFFCRMVPASSDLFCGVVPDCGQRLTMQFIPLHMPQTIFGLQTAATMATTGFSYLPLHVYRCEDSSCWLLSFPGPI